MRVYYYRYCEKYNYMLFILYKKLIKVLPLGSRNNRCLRYVFS